MPRLPLPTSPTQLLSPLIWGFGVVALIPLVVLGGIAAVLMGMVTTVVRATRSRRRPTRQLSPRPLPGAGRVLTAPTGFRALSDEPRAVLAGRHAA